MRGDVTDAGRTNNEQLKIELLSQWKLEAEFRNIWKEKYGVHTEKVHDGVVFSCEECQYSSASKRRLTLHIRIEHEGVVFSCQLCDATLKTEEYLKRHTMRKHAFKKHE